MTKILRLSFLLLPFIFSCEGKEEPLPAYIHIDSINFKYQNVSLVGNGGTAITDAWIYDNGNLLGVFELPANVAVLNKGETQISVRAGIKLNGISSTREPYRYYVQWDQTITLKDLDTVSITPETQYKLEIGIPLNEDFQNIVLAFDTTPFSDVPLERVNVFNEPFYLDGFVGKVTTTSSNPIFQAYTPTAFLVPVGTSAPIYLELDYKCNQDLFIGTIIEEPGSGGIYTEIISLRSTEDSEGLQWKHIYIDLTDQFSGRINATGFGLTFRSKHDNSNSEGFIYLDNVKVVNTK